MKLKWRRFVQVMAIFLLIVTLELTTEGSQYRQSVDGLLLRRGSAMAGIYVSIVLVALTSIAALLSVRSTTVFTLGIVVVAVSYFLNSAYLTVTSDVIDFNGVTLFMTEWKHASSAIFEYRSAIVKAAVPALVLVALVLIARKIMRGNILTIWWLTVPGVFVLSYMFVVPRLLETTTSFPIPFKIAGFALFATANPLHTGPRVELTVMPSNEPKYRNIVWIIDESVNPKYLTINGHQRNTTPYLLTHKELYLNLGEMSSSSNCSSSSQLILMSGIQLDELPDTESNSLRNPSVYQYAKAAGFTTHYLSGQSYAKKLQNFMTEHDLLYIDNFFQPAKTNARIGIDHQIATKLQDLLSDSEQNQFAVVVKSGSHVPWETSYPAEYSLKYAPTDSEPAKQETTRHKLLRHYESSLSWNVDFFFKLLLDRLNLKDTIIFYTSDHGQSIIPENKPGMATHCDARSPSLEEGIVPFLLFGNEVESMFDSGPYLDAYSHFQIFPTTVRLFGFDKTSIDGISIFDKPDDASRAFLSGDMFGRGELQIHPLVH